MQDIPEENFSEVIDANRSQPSLAPATAAESLQQLQKSLASSLQAKKSLNPWKGDIANATAAELQPLSTGQTNHKSKGKWNRSEVC